MGRKLIKMENLHMHVGRGGRLRVQTLDSQVRTTVRYHSGKEPFSHPVLDVGLELFSVVLLAPRL